MKKTVVLMSGILLLGFGVAVGAQQPSGYRCDFTSGAHPYWMYSCYCCANGAADVGISYSNELFFRNISCDNAGKCGLCAGIRFTGINFNILAAPYCSFKAKRVTAGALAVHFEGPYTDSTTWSFNKTINCTTQYQEFTLDLTADLAAVQSSGKTVRDMFEVLFYLNSAVGYYDDGFYLDDVALSDSVSRSVGVVKRATGDKAGMRALFVHSMPASGVFVDIEGKVVRVAPTAGLNGSAQLPRGDLANGCYFLKADRCLPVKVIRR
jgi:hypothetical protein